MGEVRHDMPSKGSCFALGVWYILDFLGVVGMLLVRRFFE